MTREEAITALQAATENLIAATAALAATEEGLPETDIVIGFGTDGDTVEILSDKAVVFVPGTQNNGRRSVYDWIVASMIYSPPAGPVGKKTCPRCKGTGKVK